MPEFVPRPAPAGVRQISEDDTAVITVETSADPRPITLVLANLLRRSAADPELSKIMMDLEGVMGLQSSTDPQRVTLRFRRGSVSVENGLSPDADVVISTDFNAPTGPDTPRPGLRETFGLARSVVRRPLFAQAVAKVLEPPLPSWRSAVDGFWETCCRRGPSPASLKVVCTDTGPDGGELVLGRGVETDGSSPPIEIHGSARVLARCFVGEAIVGEAALAGELLIHGTIGDLSILSGAGLAMMLGD